jgi:hypothetical protein
MELIILSDAELSERYADLRSKLPLISKMDSKFAGMPIREKLNSWYVASRPDLLRRMNIRENMDYPGVYVDNTPAESNNSEMAANRSNSKE